MRTYFAYIRVSTVKQGEKGSSLVEQKDAILRYAQKNNLHVAEFFEEQVTAAKQGRVVFRRMLTRLKRGGAHGLILHKIDRGARNLSDWAEIAALKDIGIDVHLAHEAIDLDSRGGRLSADIQAVVAADFIRNLRDEVKKGIYGRLKQGQYPFKAPPGYIDTGKGSLKAVHPAHGPLVRQAFELYASGNHTLETLRAEMARRGLTSRSGKPLAIDKISRMLATTFYYGLITVKGQTFEGKHEPLITKDLFDRVRAQASSRLYPRAVLGTGFEYPLRKLIQCGNCNRALYGERQKGFTYYRCHTRHCRGTSIREATCLQEMARILSYLPAPQVWTQTLLDMFEQRTAIDQKAQEAAKVSAKLQLANLAAQEQRITDLYIAADLDKDTYLAKKSSIQNERLAINGRLQNQPDERQMRERLTKFLELAKALQNMEILENQPEIRKRLESSVSNFVISQKSIEIQWLKPFEILLDLGGMSEGEHLPNPIRTGRQKFTVRDELPPCEHFQNLIQQRRRRVIASDETFLTALEIDSSRLFHAILDPMTEAN